MTALRILVGVLLLILGRQLYWLFVGGVGFITAVNLASYWAAASPPWFVLTIALLAGLVGALLAIFLQEIGVGMAGFLAGGSVALGVLDMLSIQAPAFTWIFALVGAVIGLVVALLLFDWSLILLSSLSGAALIAQSLNFNPAFSLLVFALALILGIGIQANMMKRQEQADDMTRPEQDVYA